VVFRSQQQADTALEALSSFDIFGKKMVLHYAKTISDETRQ
jgi:hypothetical protein